MLASIFSVLLFGMVSQVRCGEPYSSGPLQPPPASNQSTGNPSGCKHPTYFFPQPVYHDTDTNGKAVGNSEMFLQQYQLITDFYEPGGPILFWQGAEQAEFLCVEHLAMYEQAKELGALIVSIEHRYYGVSIPFGMKWKDNARWPTRSLYPLTLENISLDTISLLRWVKKNVYGASGSNAILIGGSYGALLTAHIKNTYPDDIFGAIASSPPVLGQASDPSDPFVYGIARQASIIYQFLSAKAAFRIQSAFTDLHHLIDTNSLSSMKETYHLCTQPKTHADALVVLDSFTAIFTELLEFNWPIDITTGQWLAHPYPAERTVDDIAALPEPISSAVPLKIAFKYWLSWKGLPEDSCFDWATTVRGSGMLPYSWVRCHWAKHPDAWAPADSIFGLNAPPNNTDNILNARCQADFGIDAWDATPELLARIRTGLDDYINAERLIVTRGEYDCVAGAGFPLWLPDAGLNASRPIQVAQGAHVADVMVESEWDHEGIRKARKEEIEIVKSWLGMTS